MSNFLLKLNLITIIFSSSFTTKITCEESKIKAQQYNFPFQVSLKYFVNKTKYHICGGIIISDNKILTAAHCLYFHERIIESEFLQVAAGDVNVFRLPIVRWIKSFVIHPNFYFKTFDYDVAVIFLERKLYLNDLRIGMIDLASEEFDVGTNCTFSGWGLRNLTNFGHLHYGHVTIDSRDLCSNIWSHSGGITKNMICAGMNEEVDPCNGDSGGALVCYGKLAGIVSFGAECDVKGYPGVYTNVKELKNWIYSVNSIGLIGKCPNLIIFLLIVLYFH